MTHAAVFDSLVVHNEEGDHTKQKCNAIVCSGRTKSQHTAQVAKQNKQENRTNIVDKPSCIAAQNTASHIGKGFIGHLQRNKVKYLVGSVDLIESVDSIELLGDIDARAKKLGVVQDVLLEVNIAGELSKSGVEPERLPELLDFAASLEGLRVRGLMSIPPISAAPGANRPYFARMYELFVDIGGKKYDNTAMDFLSMGMSGDFEDAIAEGANMVRVGSAIFGARDYGTGR